MVATHDHSAPATGLGGRGGWGGIALRGLLALGCSETCTSGIGMSSFPLLDACTSEEESQHLWPRIGPTRICVRRLVPDPASTFEGISHLQSKLRRAKSLAL